MRKGDKFKLNEDAIANYGEQCRDKVFTVSHGDQVYHLVRDDGTRDAVDTAWSDMLVIVESEVK